MGNASRVRYPDHAESPQDHLPGLATHVRIAIEPDGRGEMRFQIDAVDDVGNFSVDVDDYATLDEALACVPHYLATYVAHGIVTRDNQEPDVIYVGTDGTVFISPDGVGRFYYDSIAQARDEYLYPTTVRFVRKIED